MAEWRWQLKVRDSFTITGRGTAAVGDFEGFLRSGEPAVIRRGDISEAIEKVFPEVCGTRDAELALLLHGIDKSRVPPGTIIHSVE